MTTANDVYIVAAKRTPVAKAPRGMFKTTRPDDLLAHVLAGTLNEVSELDPALIDDVIIGCAMPEGEQGMNVARISALLAGLPDTVPAMTINRFCCSGVQSIALGAQQIALGQAQVIVAGGVESMSMVPMGGNKMTVSPSVFENDEHLAIAYGMGITAEVVANRWDVSREAQDAFAYQSHQRALDAQKNNYFADEILPTSVSQHYVGSDLNLESNEFLVEHDEGPRQETSIEALAKLRSVFAAKGTVTAGNASQMSDGAGAVVLVSEAILKQFNLTPIGRFVGYAVAGVAPDVMGIGPVAAIPKVLDQTNLQLDDMSWIELNEAFAAQSLAVINELKLDPAKVNPLGGAIALGHPLGATGAVRTATLLHGLRRTKQKYGMVTMCIGTGMGAAGIFEAL